jgi:phenol hydroxylase P2 protein
VSSASAVRQVALHLQAHEDGRSLAQAILGHNASAVVRYAPGLVTIEAPGSLTIRREEVENLLGRPWDTNELNLSIVSYAGNFTHWDEDHITIEWEH